VAADQLSGQGGSDTLLVNGLAGDDVLDASSSAPNSLFLTLEGGDGNDIVLGPRKS
jgi:hypothetical protein